MADIVVLKGAPAAEWRHLCEVQSDRKVSAWFVAAETYLKFGGLLWGEDDLARDRVDRRSWEIVEIPIDRRVCLGDGIVCEIAPEVIEEAVLHQRSSLVGFVFACHPDGDKVTFIWANIKLKPLCLG